ncbi:MAG TPA: NAD(+) diphosphatase [Micromonosporaceae bacterium]
MTEALPPLARSALHRRAHLRGDEEWLARAWERSRVLVVERDQSLVRADGRLLLLDPADAPDGDRYFLGEDSDGVPYFAVSAPLPGNPGAERASLRDVGHALSDLDAGLLITAVSLANWHARHGYSPHDGSPTIVTQGGWVRGSADGTQHFPRTDPAVIVLVHDGVPGEAGRCLLGHNASWTRPGWARRYSCLAGFVEPGESAEAAVVREVEEEVGVRVSRLRYVASQAWPYPGSLMLGFTAVADPERPVQVDREEIADAQWFTRTEVRAVIEGGDDSIGLPMPASIAHYLIVSWLGGDA